MVDFRTGERKDGSKYQFPIKGSNDLYSGRDLNIYRVNDMSSEVDVRPRLTNEQELHIAKELLRLGKIAYGKDRSNLIGESDLVSFISGNKDGVSIEYQTLVDRWNEDTINTGDIVAEFPISGTFEYFISYDPLKREAKLAGEEGGIHPTRSWIPIEETDKDFRSIGNFKYNGVKKWFQMNPEKYLISYFADGIIWIFNGIGDESRRLPANLYDILGDYIYHHTEDEVIEKYRKMKNG